MADSQQFWKSMREDIERLDREFQATLLKACGGRVAKAKSNGHSKGLGQLLRPNALAQRIMRG